MGREDQGFRTVVLCQEGSKLLLVGKKLLVVGVGGLLIGVQVEEPRKPSGQMANFANNGARELKIGQNDCFFHSSLAPHAPLWKHFTSEVIPEKLIFIPFGRR